MVLVKVKFRNLLFYLLILFPFLISCDKEEIILDTGDGITIEFLEGLNDDPNFQLFRNSDRYYEMILDRDKNQTIQRISGRLLRNGIPVEDKSSGNQPKKVEFSSNLYWWLLEGETVANITYTYLNLLTGELVYVNLPPLVNWRDVLVPTVNESGYTDSQTGVFNTVIAPISSAVVANQNK